MEHASGEKDDVESTGRKIWGPTRWASVLNLLGAIQGLYGDEEYADLTITYGKLPSQTRLAQTSVKGHSGSNAIEDWKIKICCLNWRIAYCFRYIY